jgi:hypothetical protein
VASSLTIRRSIALCSRTAAAFFLVARTEPSRRLRHTLLDVDDYLKGQNSWLTNYAKRYRAGLRSELRSPKALPTSSSIGERTSRSRCDGRDKVPTSCSRFAVRSTVERSVLGSVTCFSHTPIRTSSRSRRRDPPISGHSPRPLGLRVPADASARTTGPSHGSMDAASAR